jgi:hypothetical protein
MHPNRATGWSRCRNLPARRLWTSRLMIDCEQSIICAGSSHSLIRRSLACGPVGSGMHIVQCVAALAGSMNWIPGTGPLISGPRPAADPTAVLVCCAMPDSCDTTGICRRGQSMGSAHSQRPAPRDGFRPDGILDGGRTQHVSREHTTAPLQLMRAWWLTLNQAREVLPAEGSNG